MRPTRQTSSSSPSSSVSSSANQSSSHSQCTSPCAQLHKHHHHRHHYLCHHQQTRAVPIARVFHHAPNYTNIIIIAIIICVIISKPEQFPQPVYFTMRPTTQTSSSSPSSSSVSSSANQSCSRSQCTSPCAQLHKHQHHHHQCCRQLSSPSGQRYSCSQCTMCPTTQAMKGFLINIISVITIISIKNLNQNKLWWCQVTSNERIHFFCLFFCIPKILLCSARSRITSYCSKGWTGERSRWSTATVLCS